MGIIARKPLNNTEPKIVTAKVKVETAIILGSGA